MSQLQHVTLNVYGLVQGVFFRVSAKRKADELGITGYVRNEKDGSVSIEAEGAEAQIELFKAWCHQGPSGANVERVVATANPIVGFSDFSIYRQ